AGSGKDRSMIRKLFRLLSGARRTSSPPKGDPRSSTSSASTTDEAPLVGADLRMRGLGPRLRLRRSPRAPEGEGSVEPVGPVDPLDPLKRDEGLPGADPVVDPVPPET